MSLVTKKLEMPVTIRGDSVITVEHSEGPKTVAIGATTMIDLRRTHSIICCLAPKKAVTVIDGVFLRLEYSACHACMRCKELIQSPVKHVPVVQQVPGAPGPSVQSEQDKTIVNLS